MPIVLCSWRAVAERQAPEIFGVFSAGCFGRGKADERFAWLDIQKVTRGVVEHKFEQPTLRSSRVRRWLGHLWREWTIESRRPIAPAFAKPEPREWNDARVTVAWLGHSTVLINFFGITVLT